MAEKKAAKKGPTKTAKRTAGKASEVFSAEERAAMKELVQERRGKGEGEGAVLARIASMPQADRALAQRIHAIVRSTAPELTPKTWYGMPAYANKEGKVVCFFQDAAKFKARYATIGFSDTAKLDEGALWPTSFALTKLTDADERKIAALVRKAVH